MRLATLAAVSGVALASSAFAGFSFTHATTADASGRDAILFRAINDGAGTGTKLNALQLDFTIGGGNAFFVTDDTDFDGTVDEVGIANAGNVAGNSFVRIGSAANTFIVQYTPSDATQWVDGINAFGVVATTLNAPAATGAGAVFARLLVTPGASVSFVGQMGGDTGGPINVEYTTGGGTVNNPPAFSQPVYDLVIDFGPGVTPWPGSASGSVVVSATDPDAGQTVAISNGALPSFASVVGTNPATYSASLTIEEALALGWTGFGPLVLPDIALTATDSGSPAATASAALRISIIPEPATLGLLAGAGLLALRRRA